MKRNLKRLFYIIATTIALWPVNINTLKANVNPVTKDKKIVTMQCSLPDEMPLYGNICEPGGTSNCNTNPCE